MVASPSLKMLRAQDLTTAELPTLDAWNEALDQGDLHTADRVAQAGLDLEHLISTAPFDTTQITPDERTEFRGLFALCRSLGIAIPHMARFEDDPELPVIIHNTKEVPSARRANRPPNDTSAK